MAEGPTSEKRLRHRHKRTPGSAELITPKTAFRLAPAVPEWLLPGHVAMHESGLQGQRKQRQGLVKVAREPHDCFDQRHWTPTGPSGT